MFILYATVNGFIVIFDFIISKFIIIALIASAFVLAHWETKAKSDELINDTRRLS